MREAVAHANVRPHDAWPRQAARPPARTRGAIYDIVPADARRAYDVRDIVACIVDGSDFAEFKSRYGTTLVCGFAHVDGHPVGILANNGILFSESALKGRALHRALRAPRHAAGVLAEQSPASWWAKTTNGAASPRTAAKLVTAVASANVPKFTVVIGGSFGAGNYGMCGRAFSPNQLWMWPNARISVMGGEQAASTLLTVRMEAHKAKGAPLDAAAQAAFKRRSSRNTKPKAIRTTRRRGCGTTASSIRPTRATCSHSDWQPRAMRPPRATTFGIFRM